MVLRWPFPKLCSVIPTFNQDGHQGKQEVGIWRVKKRFPRYGVTIWSLWPNIRFLPSIVAEKNVTFFVTFFSGNYRWQKSDIWSQASYRYPISWEAFLDPSDSYFLSDSCHPQLLRKMWRKMCIYKCMLNVYKNQQNRQTGSRNLMGQKTLPTIWGTFWTRQIPTSCLPI
jgi:hypothetical protein